MSKISSRKRANLYPLLPVAASFALGIGVEHVVEFEARILITLVAIFAVSALVIRVGKLASLSVTFAFFFLGAFCLSTEADSIGADRIRTLIDSGAITSGSVVEVQGTLKSPPEPTADGTILKMDCDELKFRGHTQHASGKVRIFITLADEESTKDLKKLDLKYGSTIIAAGELSREESFQNPGVTSRIDLLDRQRIDAILLVKSPQLIEHVRDESVFLPIAWTYYLRQYLINRFHERFSISTAGVLSASMLGNKYYLDKTTAEAFREGGTFHVLVISGLHITFIGGILLLLVSSVTRNRLMRFAVTAGVLWAYTIAVGADAPVVRASLMFTIVMFGLAIGRPHNLVNSFAACVLGLLAWRPSDLFDPSLQLTLLSIAAIVFIAFPLIKKLRATGGWMPSAATPFPPNAARWLVRFCEMLYWNPATWRIELSRQIWSAAIRKSPYLSQLAIKGGQKTITYIFEGVLVSLIVQTCLLPLLIIYFHRLSPVSIVMNLWVGVVMAAESFTALTAVALSSISEFLAAPFFTLTEFFNYLMVSAPSWLINGTWASWRLPDYSGPFAAIYFIYFVPIVALAFLLFRWDPFLVTTTKSAITFGSKKIHPIAVARAATAVLTVFVAVIVFHPFSLPRADGRLHVDFLDVGQGDSALVTFPDGATMLIDGGGRIEYKNDEVDGGFVSDAPGIGEAVVSPVLWDKGYSRIDYVLATHADADHMQGLVDVVKNFRIDDVLIGRQPKDDPEFRAFDDVVMQRRIPIDLISRGKIMKIGGATVEVLYPVGDSSPNAASDNDHSVVIRITFGNRAFLLTGDIESDAERQILTSGGTLRADVVKVPHHGSRTSSTSEFIDATGAEYAVISVGRHSRFGHPHKEVVDRWFASGAKVMTTGERGMISVSTNGSDLAVSTYK
jgi:competence protein ComEC